MELIGQELSPGSYFQSLLPILGYFFLSWDTWLLETEKLLLRV